MQVLIKQFPSNEIFFLKIFLDDLLDLLEEIGDQLLELELYAVEQLDLKAIAMISIYCKNLSKSENS